MTARPVARTLAALGAAALLVSTCGVQVTVASWRDPEHARGTFAAGVLNAPAAGGCTRNGRTFTPSWTPAPVPSVSPASYRYRLYWTPLLGSESLVLDWTSTGTTRQFSYTSPAELLQAGTYRFEVGAVRGSWTSPSRGGTATMVVVLTVASISNCGWP